MKHRRSLVLAIGLVLVMSAITGGTIAWFTDEVVSEANQIISGKLDVDVLYQDENGDMTSIQGVNALFQDVALWEPGVLAYENLTVTNLGNLALEYTLEMNATNQNNVQGNYLADALQVAFIEGGVDHTLTREEILASANEWKPFSAFRAEGQLYPAGTEGKDQAQVYGVLVYWQPTANDNQWNVNNGKTTSDGRPLHIDLGVKLIATQLNYEEDSFGPDYDADPGVYHVSTVDELQDAIEKDGAYIVLKNDILLDNDSKMMFTDGNGAHLYFYHVNSTLDLNGHNITVEADALMEGKTSANAVILVRYSNLDIVGEGKIIAKNKSIPVYGWAHSEINIYGGTFETNAFERNESAVYVNNPTVTIHVYGGNYADNKYAFNAHDNNCGNTPVIVLHDGIEFDEFYKGTTALIASDLNKGRIVIAEDCTLLTSQSGETTQYRVTNRSVVSSD